MTNANVYLLAEYYQIPELKDLAMDKFEYALDDHSTDDFVEVVCLIYETDEFATAEALKRNIAAYITQNVKALSEESSFLKICSHHPEILVDALPHFAGRDCRQRKSLNKQRKLTTKAKDDLNALKANKEIENSHLAWIRSAWKMLGSQIGYCAICDLFMYDQYRRKTCNSYGEKFARTQSHWPVDM